MKADLLKPPDGSQEACLQLNTWEISSPGKEKTLRRFWCIITLINYKNQLLTNKHPVTTSPPYPTSSTSSLCTTHSSLLEVRGGREAKLLTVVLSLQRSVHHHCCHVSLVTMPTLLSLRLLLAPRSGFFGALHREQAGYRVLSRSFCS